VPPVWICELTPITRPAASINGPPELPWFSAASVWMTWSISSPFGAWIGRCRALTMPAVAVRSSPNGFPIASTWSPTRTESESPSGSGLSAREVAVTLRTAMSVEGSEPTMRAFMRSLFEKLTSTDRAPEITW
jgi:hypothetical protein